MDRKLTFSDARQLMLKGKPWTFRLECHSGGSQKFWLATGRGRYEPVEVHFGRVGAAPVISVRDWLYLETKVPEKLAKGYVPVATPFVRVQPSTLVAVQPAPLPPPPAPPPVPSPPPPVAAPSVGDPWSRVVAVQRLPDGWWGVDALGCRVVATTRAGAQAAVRGTHIVVQGL